MSGFIKRSSMVIFVSCLLLTGCGDNMEELTTVEENIVVTYASGAVAKANKKQAQGMTYAVPEAMADNQEDTENISGENNSEEPDAEESNPASPTAGDPVTDSGVQAESTTLTQALNMDGIEAEYKDYYISETYVQGDYFALEAPLEGYTYLFLNITLTNKAAEQVTCDMFTANTNCWIVVNGETKSAVRNTMLLNDLSTYMETMEGGASEETILIFPIKKEDAENITSLGLILGMGENNYNIDLE